jgi:hypothetical protein
VLFFILVSSEFFLKIIELIGKSLVTFRGFIEENFIEFKMYIFVSPFLFNSIIDNIKEKFLLVFILISLCIVLLIMTLRKLKILL